MRSAALTLRSALLLSLLIIASPATAAPRTITGAGFTYYVLSLYWLPTLCLESPADDECQGLRRSGFVVHGLRPSLDYNSPVNCGGSDVLSGELIDRMKDLIPTRGLLQREWTEHGTCSGLAPDEFFATLRQAYAGVNIPTLGDGVHELQLTTRQVTNSFTSRDPGLPLQAVAVTCSDHAARLQEVRICLSKTLASTYCTGEMIRSACRSVSVYLPSMTNSPPTAAP
jgi:ribonuclease T2